ncbi:ubiquitin-specific protease ubp15 [Coemansia sp. RSA 1200]|nr:ubiquitin-specific protease ubp15 [Coemansia sp. RSA 1200]
MEAPLAASDHSKGNNGVTATPGASTVSPEPVYRFYLSPPPTAPMQPGLPPYHHQQQQQQHQHQQHQQHQHAPAMFQSPMGMFPYAAAPYMSLSPPQAAAQTLGGVSAFGQPAYYAPTQQPQQSMYYPSAYALPAMTAVGGMGLQPRMSSVSAASTVSSPSQSQASGDRHNKAAQHQPSIDGAPSAAAPAVAVSEADPVGRARTPIVNEAGIPMGGFGVDQDGQYIEIKFPTFGQAQVQQMLQQLHIHQEQQHIARAAAAAAANGIHQPHPVAAANTAPKDLQPDQKQLPTPISAAQSVAPADTPKINPKTSSNGKAQSDPPASASASAATAMAVPIGTSISTSTGTGTQSPNISIYDADHFANAHMEEIVFDSKAFFWKIDNWDKLERRATSDVFKSGGHIWRILLRPFGSSHKGVLSLFLECLGTSEANEDWRCTCRFVLAISNPHDPTHNTHGSAYHCFHRNNPNWGFTRFMKLADLRTAPAPGIPPYIEDGACTIAAYLHIIKEPSQ